mmetsp:Transcript_10910/g.13788  ORF Transcript_10910/g.13788 Transcript_10910/m.13788 type:complete len:295 (+) Transcript_10910:158-1042(+)
MENISFCYGPDADLYETVLEVDQDASDKDIQRSFMNQRMKLYQTMQAIDEDSERLVKSLDGSNVEVGERIFIEKKLDALIAAFRVLRDPRKRRNYDTKLVAFRAKVPKMRSSPVSVAVPLSELGNSLSEELKELKIDGRTMMMPKSKSVIQIKDMRERSKSLERARSEGMHSKRKVSFKPDMKGSSKRKERKQKSGTIGQPVDNDDNANDGVEEYYSDVVAHQESSLGSWLRRNEFNSHADTVDEVANEMAGAAADLWLTFNQVANAFAINDEAIDAVSGNIKSATREFQSRRS